MDHWDLVSPKFKQDPFPTFARLRDAGPLVRAKLPLVGDAWLVTTYESVTSILKDSRRFVQEPKNAGRRQIPGLRWWMPRSLLDPLAGADRFDLMESFARPFPVAVISEMLGLPEQDRPMFVRWGQELARATSPVGLLRVAPAMSRLLRYLRGRFEVCRREPREGLMSALVEAEEAGDRLSEDELLAMVFLLLVAGIETTVHLITVGTLVLLQHGEQRDRLAADWSGIATATDELLRYITPVQMTKPRHATCDMTLYGTDLKRGEYVFAVLASANSDPSVFAAPERLDLTRHPNPHVAFGRGVHSCLGLQLARAEAEIAFQQLFTRWHGLRLGVDPERLAWSKRLGVRALTSLPVVAHGAAA